MTPLSLVIEEAPVPASVHPVTLKGGGAVLAQGATSANQEVLDIAALQARILDDVNTAGPDFLALGQKIYNWAFAADVAAAFDAQFQAPPWPCLHLDIRGDSLDAIPWELLSTPACLRPAALGGLVRLMHAAPRPFAGNEDWPVRILLLVGSFDEKKTLGVADEVAAIEKEFVRFGRSVDLHIMGPPTPEELGGWLEKNQPHALHFVGHCARDPATGTGSLVISNPQKAWLWKATDIPQYLAKMRRPFRFVFLNACRTSDALQQSWSVQKAFLKHGVPAVLAMQANIKGSYGGAFAAGFYKACAEGQEVAQAVCAGRERMRDQSLGGTFDHRDWALPTLTMNATVAEQGPLHLFSPKPIPGDEEFQKCREFEEARLFADFRDLRRSVTRWFYPLAPNAAETGKNALLVIGEPRCGKSHLVKWCLESFAISGPRIRYVLVNEGKPKNFLELLRQVRDGEAYDQYDPAEYGLLHSGLPPGSFKRFNWELNNLLEKGAKGEWVEAEHPEAVIDDAKFPLAPKGENLLPAIFSSFAEALRLCAAKRPLLLVFDQFSGPQGERFLPAGEFKTMVRSLFTPLIQGPGSAVKLVFVAARADHDYYGLAGLPRDRVHTVEVPHEFKSDGLGGHASRMHGLAVTLPEELKDEEQKHLYLCACEMFWYDLDESLDLLARGVAKRKSSNLKGLARLSMLRTLLETDGSGLTWVERMR